MRFLLLMPKYIRAIQNNTTSQTKQVGKTPNFIEKSTSAGHISSFLNAIDTYIESRYTSYIEMRYIKA